MIFQAKEGNMNRRFRFQSRTSSSHWSTKMESQTALRGHLGSIDGGAGAERPGCADEDSISFESHDDDACSPSLCPSRRSMWEWCLGWRQIFCMQPSTSGLVWINAMSVLGVFLGEILICEASTTSIRSRRHATAIFPVYVPNAVALAFACKWSGSVGLSNFAGFFTGQLYLTARTGSSFLGAKIPSLFILSFIEIVEVQICADILRRKLCHNRRKAMPTIDTVQDAALYVLIVAVDSLCFETLGVIVRCTSGLTKWSLFARLWSTRWLAVLAGFLTLAPTLIHAFAYVPRYSRMFTKGKVFEFVVLTVGSIIMLGLVIFSMPFTTVIRPLPYLLYPLLIFSVFRFNQLGWSVVVAAVAFFGSWGSIHYKSSALYYTSGSSRRSSPMLIIQLELFMSVFGIVAISLAGAVREKKQLAKDLHNINQKLEDAVTKRTQELIKANMDLQVSQTHAEKANLAKSDFLANMSHEIRTPIHGILGLTALLLQSELSADQLENLQSVKDCADLLLHIINSILDLAKIEAGRLDVEFTPFSIRKVVSGTLRMLQVRAKERGLQLLWKVDGDVPPVIAGDPGKIQQCLLNLVGNALKFTHSGSVRVRISLGHGYESSFSHVLSVRNESFSSTPKRSPSLPARLRSWASWPSSETKLDVDNYGDDVTSSIIDMINMQFTDCSVSSKGSSGGTPDKVNRSSDMQIADLKGQDYLLIEVTDTGIGISREQVRDMFNPFTQADASTSRLYGGTGLGLSIVHRFVELLGGKIWVESEIGKGSMFSFVVPFRRVKGDANERVGGSPLTEMRAPQPQVFAADKPPRARRKAATQNSTLGRSRRAHSLNTLMKNLKFTTAPVDEGEPLLPLAIISNAEELKLSSREADLDFDRRHRSRTEDGPGAAEKPVPSALVENGTDISEGECSGLAESTIVQNKFDSKLSSAETKENQLETAIVENRLGVGKDQIGVPSHSDNSLRDKTGSAFNDESFPPTSDRTGTGLDPYPDLELGIADTKSKRGIVETSTEGRRGTGELPSLAAAQPIASANKEENPEAHQGVPSLDQPPGKAISRKEKLHVLLAEDNLINQRVATRQLQKHGHMVTIVGDGLQALNTVRQHHDKFDLVLMDIQMPMMDGLQATERIRAEEAEHGWARLPILGLTAHAISGYQDICLSHGMDAYLGKPFDIQQLLKIIQKFI